MYAQQLGFVSSWKMLTRDKGWIKPLLILTLVGWIPSWARSPSLDTAWSGRA